LPLGVGKLAFRKLMPPISVKRFFEESVQVFLDSSLARTKVSAGGCGRSGGDVSRNTLNGVAMV
jgi:hypothetical protein